MNEDNSTNFPLNYTINPTPGTLGVTITDIFQPTTYNSLYRIRIKVRNDLDATGFSYKYSDPIGLIICNNQLGTRNYLDHGLANMSLPTLTISRTGYHTINHWIADCFYTNSTDKRYCLYCRKPNATLWNVDATGTPTTLMTELATFSDYYTPYDNVIKAWV